MKPSKKKKRKKNSSMLVQWISFITFLTYNQEKQAKLLTLVVSRWLHITVWLVVTFWRRITAELSLMSRQQLNWSRELNWTELMIMFCDIVAWADSWQTQQPQLACISYCLTFAIYPGSLLLPKISAAFLRACQYTPVKDLTKRRGERSEVERQDRLRPP